MKNQPFNLEGFKLFVGGILSDLRSFSGEGYFG